MSTFVEQIAISLDLGNNEIKNLVIDKLSVEPSTGLTEGRIYYNSSTDKYGYYNGTAWQYFETASHMTTELAKKQGNLKTDSTLSLATEADANGKYEIKVVTTALDKATASTVGVVKGSSNITVDANGELDLATGSVEFNKMDSEAVVNSTVGIGAASTASDEKFPTAKAVAALVESSISSSVVAATESTAGIVELATNSEAAAGSSDSNLAINPAKLKYGMENMTATLKNKSIDLATSGDNAGNNTITNAQTSIFAAGVVETDLASSTTNTDTTLASAKAIKTYVDAAKLDVLRYKGTWSLQGEAAHISSENAGLTLSVDKDALKAKLENPTEDQELTFTYNVDHWELNETSATLSEYGVVVEGEPSNEDTIEVEYKVEDADIADLTTAKIKKGDFWIVRVADGPVNVDGVEFDNLDHIVANQDVAAGATLSVAMFDKIDNTESGDLVRLADAQTLTNKTLDAANNIISNLTGASFKTEKVSLGTSEQKADMVFPSLAKVGELISASAPGVDNVTIESYQNTSGTGPDYNVRVKDGGVSFAKMNSDAVATSIAATSNDRSSQKLTTETAVGTALDGKQNLAVPAAAGNIATLNASGQSQDSGKAFVTEVGPASGNDAATDTEIPTAAAVRTAVDATAHIVVIPTTSTSNFQMENTSPAERAFWTVSTPWTGHDVLSAKLLDANGNEVYCHIKYGMTEGPNPVGYVEFGINCSSAPKKGAYKALIVG